jgi:hypothetical protein
MDPVLRRRLLAVGAIVIVVLVLAAIAAAQPGSPLRTRWELARVRKVETHVVVYLAPGSRFTGDAKSGWRVPALRPTHPVWRYQVVELRLLPGCEIVLPKGVTGVVAGSTESTLASGVLHAATAAVTVSAAEVDRGRELVCRRVVVGRPPFESIASDLKRGAASADAPVSSTIEVAGRASFQRSGSDDVLVLGIPERQAEGSFAPAERQYALLRPNTLYIEESETSAHAITLAQVRQIIRADPTELASAVLEQRGFAMFAVQVRVRSGR